MRPKFSRHAIEKLNDATSKRLGITTQLIDAVLNRPDLIDNSEYPVFLLKGGDMKVKYYPEDDIMVLRFSEKPYDYAEKIGSFIIHYTKDKEPVMLEILKASQFLKETTEALPYPTLNKILHLQTA